MAFPQASTASSPLIDGEPLPAPEPQQSFGGGEGRIDMLFNPLVIFGVFVVGGLLRTLLGRLIGSAATGGVVGLVAWLAIGSLAFSLLAAVLAFVFAMFAGSMASSNGRGGSWSGGGGSFSGGGSSGGGFSGGGGSFGGGGASGSW